MSQASSRGIDLGRGGDVLFIVLVAVSYIITFSMPMESATPLRIGALIAAGIVFTIVGLYSARHLEQTSPPLLLAAYFAVQLLLGAAIVYLSEGRGWLILLPVAASAVEWLSHFWAAVVSVLGVFAVVGTLALLVSQARMPDGELLYPWFSPQFWELLMPAALQYLMAFTFVILFTLAGVRERRARTEVERLASELREANRQLREYAAQVEQLATVHERNRLAREIHDGLGHYLTAINMQIQAGRAVLDHDRDVALDALEKAQALAQEGLKEVRRSVTALRASPLDNQSLPQAIETLVDECRAAGIATRFTVSGEALDLSPQVELTLYRAAQEGMTNMRKHAQASSAEITLEYRDEGRVRLAVSDSGVGTDDPSGGYGLVGIRERVHMMGGEMHIDTLPGAGFRLEVEVPTTL